jgi:peptidoglycan/LPS O-acetylase OafA/YrhL
MCIQGAFTCLAGVPLSFPTQGGEMTAWFVAVIVASAILHLVFYKGTQEDWTAVFGHAIPLLCWAMMCGIYVALTGHPAVEVSPGFVGAVLGTPWAAALGAAFVALSLRGIAKHKTIWNPTNKGGWNEPNGYKH